MTKITTVLFDFDGVIANTEPQYDIFSKRLMVKYELPDNFVEQSRGVTLDRILTNFFSGVSQAEKDAIRKESDEFELTIDYEWILGVQDFIQYLKEKKYKIGLVTSSTDMKMEIAFREMNLEGLFDTMVTSSRISDSKPNPMCYQLAAKDLGASPEECIVFEDSLFGVQAGVSAGMKVVGIATSFPREVLQNKTDTVLFNFKNRDQLIDLLG